MRNDFLDERELRDLGLASVGTGVRISRHALILCPERIAIGDHTRIDAFCVVSAGEGVSIGRNVHVSAYASLLGRRTIEIGDFATVSVRCSIFASNDDYSGATMVNPTVPDRYRGSVDGPVSIGAHAVLGAGSIVLPGVTVGESAAVGALSLVKTDVAPYAIAAGVPARVIGQRVHGHRVLLQQMLSEEADGPDSAGS
jgi:acetyltransferase-like isoleucine patch superfamily enzyme